MISSDKAVNPICVMGATRLRANRLRGSRMADQVCRCVLKRPGQQWKRGPGFQSQIAAGGPLKVTHPEARRYFMTISEAVSLVVQASTRSEGSEIFVLDMGEPIRIVDLAENMIRLAGKVPYEEIDIEFTGLRPGEKLIEEIRGKSEGLLPTSMEKMHVIREQPLIWDKIDGWIDELKDLISERQERAVIAHLQKLVPEFSPAVRGGRQPLELVLSNKVSELRSASVTEGHG